MNESENRANRSLPLSMRQIAFLVCVLLVAAILLTYTLTAAAFRRAYTEKLLEQQESLGGGDSAISKTAENLELLDQVIEAYSYYADTLDKKAMQEAIFRAYVEASGDAYARYYTEAEYEAFRSENNAELYGVGIGVLSKTFTVQGAERLGFYIFDIYEGSSAQERVRIGDWVDAVMVDGIMKTVSELGHSAAAGYISGAENTEVTLRIYRPDDGTFFDATFVRRKFESKSVYTSQYKDDPSIAIVRITSFDLKTPIQLKQAMKPLLDAGVTSFVFDVRNNPGGDLQSIRAVASYFLQNGDLVLEQINRNGEIVKAYRAEPVTMTGEYVYCSVTEEEIGMYASYPAVVLCNDSTASAGELFTAVFRDYNLAPTVGVTTYGKGTVQQYFDLAMLGYEGVLKLTVEAYYPPSDQGYDGIGIAPDYVVEPSEEMWSLNSFEVNIEKDNQLASAVSHLLGNS